jgi:hypothetical protein
MEKIKIEFLQTLIDEIENAIEKAGILQINAKENSKIENKNDARLVALNGIANNLFIIRFFYVCCKKNVNEGSSKYNFGKIVYDNKLEYFDDFGNSFYIKALLDGIYFILDNLFQNILGDSKKYKFKSNITELFNKLITDYDEDKKKEIEDPLDCLGQMRNSLHNNGVHRHPREEYTIGGYDYKFEKGKVVKCASWDHVLTLVNAIIDSLREILMHENIVSKPEIKDPANEEVNNNPEKYKPLITEYFKSK